MVDSNLYLAKEEQAEHAFMPEAEGFDHYTGGLYCGYCRGKAALFQLVTTLREYNRKSVFLLDSVQKCGGSRPLLNNVYKKKVFFSDVFSQAVDC